MPFKSNISASFLDSPLHDHKNMINLNMDKVIKAVEMKKFSLKIVELPSGKYQIIAETNSTKQVSEELSDFGLTSFLFDMKLIELEGH